MKTFADFGILNVPSGGDNVYTLCPKCSDSRKKKRIPCLSVNNREGLWNCHHCGWSGSLGKGEAASLQHWQKPEYTKPVFTLGQSIPPEFLSFFQARGISLDTVKRYGIQVQNTYMPQVEDYRPALTFPFYRGDEVVNLKYRDAEKNFKLHPGAQRVFYGLNDIGIVTIIVEGEMDKLALFEAGFPHCLSVPDGAPPPDSKNYANKFDFIDNCVDELAQAEAFIIAVDSDEPGYRLEQELTRRLGRERCYLVQWPEGCKDANEVLIKHGKAALAECINNAQPYPIEGIITADELADDLESLYINGLPSGLQTGFKQLEKLYTVAPGEWTLVTGIPGHGKSEFIDQILVNLAKQYGHSFVIYSPENRPPALHVAKLLEKYLGKPFRAGPTSRMTIDEMREARAWVSKHFHFLHLEDSLSVRAVLDKTKSMILRHGANGLLVDPWNELDHSRPAHLMETEYISVSLTEIRNFTRVNGIHTWIVAHPQKLMKDARKDGKYPVPGPYDISGSAHWNNKADNILAVYRDKEKREEPVEVHVQKVRRKQNGMEGLALFDYNYVTGQYIDHHVYHSHFLNR